MARRKKNKSRRRRFRGVNAWNAAESLFQAHILTENFAGTSLWNFFTSGMAGGSGSGFVAGTGKNWNQIITLKEIFSGTQLGTDGSKYPIGAALKSNFQSNWGRYLLQSVGTRVGFSVAKRLTRKMRGDVNKGLRMAGLGNEVRV